jgi:hypothetical protein
MSVDKTEGENPPKQDISWKSAISDAEKQIQTHQETIKRLRKSIIFFKKQEEASVPFPQKSWRRHAIYLDIY